MDTLRRNAAARRRSRLALALLAGLATIPGPGAGAAEIDDSVVKIVVFSKEGMASGSGVVINDDGVIVTNAHVVHGATALYIVTDPGRVAKVRVLWETPALDLAAISGKGLNLPALPLATVPLVREQTVRAFGYPGVANTIDLDMAQDEKTILKAMGNKEPVTVTRGNVSNVTRRDWGLDGSGRAQAVLHTAAIHHGNSGGPLLDECNRVVGINTALAGLTHIYKTDDNEMIGNQSVTLYKALDASEVIGDLHAHHVSFTSADGPCQPATAVPPAVPAASTSWLVWAAGGVLLLLGGVVLTVVLRRPRERVIHVQERYSSWLRRQPAPPRPPVGDGWSGLVIVARPEAGAAELRAVIGRDRLEQGGIVLGRNSDCALEIPSRTVSRHHLRLLAWQGGVQVEDLKSSNGTVIEGRGPIPPKQMVELTLPATLRLGDVVVRISQQ